MTTTLTRPPKQELATERQIKFLKDLIEQRELTSTERTSFTEQLETMTKKAASPLIGMLIKREARIVNPTLMAEPFNEVAALLAQLQKSKFAVPMTLLDPLTFKTRVNGDLIFVEIKEYRSRITMRRLTGAPGSFNRSLMDSKDILALAKIIAKDELKYVQLFGQHYSCCGKCAAELTDPVSRRLLLGPDCRMAFGFDRHGNYLR